MGLNRQKFITAPVVTATSDNLYTYVSMVDATSRANFTNGSATGQVTWVDISGNSRDWIVNSVGNTLVTTLSGNYFQKNTNNDLHTTATDLNLGTDLSLEFWVYMDAIASGYFQGLRSNYDYLWLTYHRGPGSGQQASLYTYPTGADENGYAGWTNVIAYDAWHQITMTINETGGEKKLYVNGSQLGSTVSHTTGRFVSGSGLNSRFSLPTATNQGRIGIIRLYSDVLTAAEVLTNYNTNKASFGLS